MTAGSRATGRPSRGPARAARFLVRWGGLVLLLLAGAQCSDDQAPQGTPGGLGLTYRTPGLLGGTPDSLRLWVLNSSGATLLGPLAGALDDGGAVDLQVTVAAGDGYAIHLQLEGAGPLADRGVLAEGRATGITVRPATATDVDVQLHSVIPQMDPLLVDPGDLQYRLSWRPVTGAVGYVLEEDVAGEVAVYEVADTSRVFAAAASLELLSYRVRARLNRGTTVRSEEVSVDLGEVRDLPRVVEVDPPDGTMNLLDDVEPMITFDRPMDWNTLEGALRVIDEETETEFEIDPVAAVGSSQVQLSHSAAFLRGRAYRVELDAGILGLDGRPFDQDPETVGLQGFSSRFGIEVYDPLRVSGVTPADGAADVSIGTEVVIDFDRPVDPVSVTSETVRLRTLSGNEVAAERRLENGDQRVRVVPEANLDYEGSYGIEVTTGVVDLRGEPLDQDPNTPIPVFEPFASSFSVETQPVGPRVDAIVPEADEANAPAFGTIEVTFSRAIDPATVTGAGSFSVRKLPINANIQGALTHDAGNRIFTFDPVELLEQGTSYRVVISTAVRDEDGIPLDQDPVAAGFQPFEATFRVERNLQVTSVTPVSGAERVPTEVEVELAFNVAVDPSTVSASTLILETGGTPVAASRELRDGNRTAALIPSAPLDLFRRYDVRVESELRSFEGSRLDMNLGVDGYQSFASFFTTEPESLPPRVVEAIPEPGSIEIGVRPELSVRFNKPIKPASVNVDNFYLRAVSNQTLVLGARSVSQDSLVATFVPTVDLDVSRQYELVVTNWIVDRFDVRLDQDPVAPGRQEFFLDFTTDHEMEPPRVVAVSPPDGQDDVLPEASIVLEFSEPMIGATVLEAVSIRDLDLEAEVPGVAALSADSTQFTFAPSSVLPRDHEFAVRVETTASDLVGNLLDQDPKTVPLNAFVSSFRTQADEVGPQVVQSIPADGATNVAIDVEPLFEFTEPVDPASLGGVVLQQAGAEVALASRTLETELSVRLIPASPLEFDTPYRLVAEGVLDSLGNVLDQDLVQNGPQRFEADFRTQIENIPPRVVSLELAAVPAPIGAPFRLVFDEAVDEGSLDGNVRLWLDDEEIPVAVQLVAADTVKVTAQQELAYDALHTVEVSGVTDLVGNVLDQNPSTPEADPFVAQFRTEPDIIAPRVIDVDPPDGANGVATDVVVAVTFSEPMNPESFAFGDLRLSRLGFDVIVTITWNEDQTVFFLEPLNELEDGSVYEVHAGRQLEDIAGNDLDQDPNTPIADEFSSEFVVGVFPVADAGGGICADSPLVVVNAQGSHDPDGSLILLTVDWGDGTIEEFPDPDSSALLLGHNYPCLDFQGCDLIDNDGDGAVDEGGSAGCDESYRIIVTVRDNDAFTDADTLGVSFCAFGPLGTEPPDGTTGVDLDLPEVRIRLTKPVSEAVLTGDRFELLREGIDPVSLTSITTEEGGQVVVLALGESLQGSVEYQIRVSGTVTDTEGVRFDPDPCTPAFEAYVTSFTTEVAP